MLTFKPGKLLEQFSSNRLLRYATPASFCYICTEHTHGGTWVSMKAAEGLPQPTILGVIPGIPTVLAR